ncbi:hypothetical protein EBESD8_53670 [Rhodococcus aetherivorans]|nr:hypothetical protein EBESD8_53670 [Rhodococcus aetherivorans]
MWSRRRRGASEYAGDPAMGSVRTIRSATLDRIGPNHLEAGIDHVPMRR